MSREEFVIDMIRKGEEENLIKEIRYTTSVPGLDTYAAFLEILLQLMERSIFRDTIGAIFIDRAIRAEDFVMEASIEARSSVFVKVLKNRTPLYGVYTSDYIRMVITQILRQPDAPDSVLFRDFLSVKAYLEINEFFFERYLEKENLGSKGMHLFYNCVADLKASHIMLSRKATAKIFIKLRQPNSLRFYLRNFIRPYWMSQGQNVEEDYWYVPEPFWLQIFNHKDQFLSFIREVLREEEDMPLVIEIRNVVSQIHEPLGYIDSRYYRLNPSLHENLKQRGGKIGI